MVMSARVGAKNFKLESWRSYQVTLLPPRLNPPFGDVVRVSYPDHQLAVNQLASPRQSSLLDSQ